MIGFRKLLPALAACSLASALSAQTYIGNLNGSATASTFETGFSSVGEQDTNLAALGWTEVTGDTRLFRGTSNTAVISTGEWNTYSVRYDTGVAIQTNTVYTLSFNLGYQTNNTGNTAYYSFELGTVNGGAFSSYTSAHSGSLSYDGALGSLNIGSGSFSSDSSQWTTGGSVNGDNLAVVFTLTNYSINGSSSDFFGFDNVTLTAAAIPEPSTYAALLGLGSLIYIAWRRRQSAV